MEMHDNVFYGESEIPDCPVKGNGDYCIIHEKRAVNPPAAAGSAKAIHINSPSSLPMEKIKGHSSWGGRTIMRRNTFIGFQAKTREGQHNGIFGSNKYHADYTPMVELYDSTFINVELNALAHFDDPNPAWANLADCGEFPCTGPHNILYYL